MNIGPLINTCTCIEKEKDYPKRGRKRERKRLSILLSLHTELLIDN